MYYLVGIKGTGMSALACILYDLGYQVEGSDVDRHFFTEEELNKRHIKINNFDEKNIKENMIIVQGNAFKDDHPEIKKAKELNLTIYSYPQIVGKLTEKFNTIAVAGCHGKTSTTAMLAHVLDNLYGANYLIGDGRGHAKKNNKYFILEADEYRRHFIPYKPQYAIITNIDFDHPDYFKNLDDVIDAYTTYASHAKKMVIAYGDDQYTRHLYYTKPVFYYGLEEDDDIIAKNIKYSEKGISFDVFAEGNYYGHYDLPIYGKHQLLNTLACLSICYYERVPYKDAFQELKTFKGAKRRFSETKVKDNIVIDDYAHHPTELKATIKASKQKYPNKKQIVVFQPHTFSRLKKFFDDYVKVLSSVDKAYIMDVHGAREVYEKGDLTSDDLIKQIKNSEKITIDESDKLLNNHDSVIIFMSPNDISKLENDYIKKYRVLN